MAAERPSTRRTACACAAVVAVVWSLLVAAPASSSVRVAAAPVEVAAADAVIVRTDEPVDAAGRAAVAGAVGGDPGTVIAGDTFVVEVPEGAAARAAALAEVDGVDHVQAEHLYVAALDPGDPCWRSSTCGPAGDPWPGQLALRSVGAPAAWDVTRGSRDVVVAVLDTLVEQAPPHRDLVGKLLPGRSFVPDRSACEGGVLDARDHGTIAAGIVAAQPGNGLDMAGLGWETRVLPVEVLNDCGWGRTSWLAAGLRWAADQGADVANLSLSGRVYDPVLADAVAYARDRGVLVVAAAGNGSPGSSTPAWPAAMAGVVAVAATGAPGTAAQDVLERYSNFGPWVDIAAPGTGVTGLRRIGGSTGARDGTRTADGTSFAAPIVAAAAALVVAQHPSATPEQVAARLARTAVAIPGTGTTVAWGRLDVAAAVRPVPPGYRLVAADGGVFAFGSAPFAGSAAGRTPAAIAGAAGHVSGRGYWLGAVDGWVERFGAAPALAAPVRPPGAGPVVGVAATPGGDGYWLATRDGRALAAGAAASPGIDPLAPLAHPAVGLAAAARGDGGWVVASDGGVFSFGDAGFFGSTGAMVLNRPVVGMASTPSGRGYWLVASDGGVFAFGDAGFFGSTGAMVLNRPVVGMASTPSGRGYWLVASDGGVFAFGDAPFLGSTGDLDLVRPVVAMTAP